jgi:adenosylcobinamide-phosphate synthase
VIDPALYSAAMALIPGLWLALALDAVLGDPAWLPHPVVLIGATSQWLGKGCKQIFSSHLFLAGLLMVFSTLALTLAACLAFFFVLDRLSPLALFAGAVFLLYTTLAMRGLAEHGLAVYRALAMHKKEKGLAAARAAVARIVGRDTSGLAEEGIVRACVESVAENMSDGVVAPMLYAMVGGVLACWAGLDQYTLAAAAMAAMLYKTINTLDSMFGYTTEEFLLFGKSAALLDDAANFLPARVSGFSLLSIFCLARFCHLDGLICRAGTIKEISCPSAWQIMLRDHCRHASPKAGWPESAMAAMLGIQLGGPGIYFGTRVDKPVLGTAHVQPVCIHIRCAVLWMILASLCTALIFSCISFICVLGTD